MPHRVLIAAAVALAFLLPASAPADESVAPKITSKPTIAGTPREGDALVASAKWTGDPTPTAQWIWQRCDDKGGKCKKIAGAGEERYVPTAADGCAPGWS
jgi:hypothetical protein